MLTRTLYLITASSALLWAAAALAGEPQPAQFEQPDVLRCNKLTWLKNCSQMNETVRRNPGAPIRIVDQTGLEFTFAPGTPTVMIEHLLTPTRATAEAVQDYTIAHLARAEKAAALSRGVIFDRGIGDSGFIVGVDDALTSSNTLKVPVTSTSPGAIKYKNVKMYVFYDSKCPHCKREMWELANLQRGHPDLNLTLLQMNTDEDYLSYLRTSLGLRAGPVPANQKATFAERVDTVPTIWLQDTRNSKTRVLKGYVASEDIERALKEVTK